MENSLNDVDFKIEFYLHNLESMH